MAMVFWRNVGRARVWQGRASTYLGVFSFFNILLLANNIWIAIIEVCIAMFILYFDIKFILPMESDYAMEKTPMITEMSNNIKDIKKVLEDGK